MPRKRKPSVRWWLIISIFGVPLLLLTLGTFIFRIGYTLRENSGRRAMVEELHKFANEGQPTDNEAIAELYSSRTSAQHTEAWLNLFETLQSAEFEKLYVGVPLLDRAIEDQAPFRLVTAKDWEFASVCESFVSESSELIEEVRLLAAAPVPVQFPIYFQSMDTLLPEVQSIRQVALVIFVDSQVAINLRDDQRATQDIVTLYRLANLVEVIPSTICNVVATAIRRQALQAVQACIEIDLLQDDQLQQIDGIIQDYCEIGNRWHDAMSAELGLCLPVFTNPAIALKSDIRIPARGHDAVYFIGLMRRAMQIDTDNWSEFRRAAVKLDEDTAASHASWLQSTDRLLSGLFAPAFESLATLWIGEAQLHRQARLAIAIRLYAHRFDKLPSTLEGLPSAVARLHPFGNRPFGYELDGEQAVLWGFDLTTDTVRTPVSPPTVEAGASGGFDNYQFVWHIKRDAN